MQSTLGTVDLKIALLNVSKLPLCSTSYGSISNDTLDVYLTVPLHCLVEPAPLLPVITLARGQSLGKTEKAVERSSETGVSPLK